MRIAVLTSLYPSPPRPFEGVFAERRWRGMRSRGHEVTVTCPLPFAPPLARGAWGEIGAMPRYEERDGIPVRRPRYLHFPGRARRNARAFARRGLREVLGGPEPEVVVADYALPAAAAAPELRERRIPCLVNGRGSDVLEVGGEAGLAGELGDYLEAAGSWCAVSDDLVGAMDRLAGAPGRGRLVPNGVDLERFVPGDRSAARRELGLADGRLVVVCGHLIPRKDPRLALEAFRRGAGATDRLVYLGRGPLRDELRGAIDEAGLGERVELRGEVPPEELATWYRAADLLLLTSRREGRPNVVLEALASGCPVLATEAGGTAEVLGPFAARSLATSRDPEGLGQRLAALLDDPPSPEALRASVEPLSWERSFQALEAALAEAVERAR